MKRKHITDILRPLEAFRAYSKREPFRKLEFRKFSLRLLSVNSTIADN